MTTFTVAQELRAQMLRAFLVNLDRQPQQPNAPLDVINCYRAGAQAELHQIGVTA